MKTLVIVEHDHQRVLPQTLKVIQAATDLKQPIDAVIIGYNCAAVADELKNVNAIDKIILINDTTCQHFIAEILTPTLSHIAQSYSHVMSSSSTFGKNIMPRIAASLDVTQLSEVIRILDYNTFTHPIYAGNALETVEIIDDKKILTIRASAFDLPACDPNHNAAIETIDFIPATELRTQWVSDEQALSERPDLGSAEIVISGGRGLGSSENFTLIHQLAEKMNAAVGASRAAVDAGFVSNDLQVGQTGKIVAPNLYIAIGISGAIQHLAGMKDSKTIVAINQDPDAPIFQVADYGLQGDLFELVPQLIEQIT